MADAFVLEGVEIPVSTTRDLAGFRAWVAGRHAAGLDGPAVRAAFLGGQVFVDVSPQNPRSHEPLVAAINVALKRLAAELDLGRWFTPPTWVTTGGLSTEPDGVLVRWGSFASGRVKVDEEGELELVGPPDVAVEVVSRTSARKDRVVLVQEYAAAGVGEYWIADGRRPEAVDLQLLRLDGQAYVPVPPGPDGFVVSPTFGCAFRLRRFVDRAGLPDFALDCR